MDLAVLQWHVQQCACVCESLWWVAILSTNCKMDENLAVRLFASLFQWAVMCWKLTFSSLAFLNFQVLESMLLLKLIGFVLNKQ